MSRETSIEYPDGSFDLMVELERFRIMRDDVIPAGITGLMDRATAELIASGREGRAAGIGDRAPGFSLPNALGEQVSLRRTLTKGPVVLSFYRGIWCPFCNLELRALQQFMPQINALGGTLVAISGQTPDNSLSAAEKHRLTYEVLSDTGLAVASSYGLVFRLPGYLRAAYEELGHPIPMFNGAGQHMLPVPGTFVIAPSGIIRFAYANPDYRYRADPEDILVALRREPLTTPEREPR
jgi:peroxiredoxin